jgi:hypothetical protein
MSAQTFPFCRDVRRFQQGTPLMNTLIKMLAASGMVAGFAAPVFAQDTPVDPMTMTCADYTAMDAAGMTSATQMLDTMMAMTPEEQTAAMAMTADEKTAKMAEMTTKMDAMTADEKTAATAATEASTAKMMEACKKMPDGTVMDAAKAAM